MSNDVNIDAEVTTKTIEAVLPITVAEYVDADGWCILEVLDYPTRLVSTTFPAAERAVQGFALMIWEYAQDMLNATATQPYEEDLP
jgi:hypothetical protein